MLSSLLDTFVVGFLLPGLMIIGFFIFWMPLILKIRLKDDSPFHRVPLWFAFPFWFLILWEIGIGESWSQAFQFIINLSWQIKISILLSIILLALLPMIFELFGLKNKLSLKWREKSHYFLTYLICCTLLSLYLLLPGDSLSCEGGIRGFGYYCE